MRRFLHSLVRHLYLVIGIIVVANIPAVSSLIRSGTQEFLQSQTGRSLLGGIGQYFADHPNTIVPTSVGAALVGILSYCLYDSHFSGRPLMRVEGMPWRGPCYFAGKDGKPRIGEQAYVSITNKSEGVQEQAIARSLAVKVRLLGSKLRTQSEVKSPWIGSGPRILGERADLHPEDTLDVPVAMRNKRRNQIIAVTRSTYDSFSMDDPSGNVLRESLYLVKMTFRGIGVNQVLWFALEDFVAKPNTMGFWGPLGLFERTWVRLTLLGIGPSWQAYWGRKGQSHS